MFHNMLRKGCFLFQITLNFVLCVVQFLSYFGWTTLKHPVGFYYVLSAAMPLASVVIVLAGGFLAYRMYRHGKKLFAGVVLAQCGGAVVSLLKYRNYLLQLSAPSPAKWILTPYLAVLGAALIIAFLLRKIKGKAAA